MGSGCDDDDDGGVYDALQRTDPNTLPVSASRVVDPAAVEEFVAGGAAGGPMSLHSLGTIQEVSSAAGHETGAEGGARGGSGGHHHHNGDSDLDSPMSAVPNVYTGPDSLDSPPAPLPLGLPMPYGDLVAGDGEAHIRMYPHTMAGGSDGYSGGEYSKEQYAQNIWNALYNAPLHVRSGEGSSVAASTAAPRGSVAGGSTRDTTPTPMWTAAAPSAGPRQHSRRQAPLQNSAARANYAEVDDELSGGDTEGEVAPVNAAGGYLYGSEHAAEGADEHFMPAGHLAAHQHAAAVAQSGHMLGHFRSFQVMAVPVIQEEEAEEVAARNAVRIASRRAAALAAAAAATLEAAVAAAASNRPSFDDGGEGDGGPSTLPLRTWRQNKQPGCDMRDCVQRNDAHVDGAAGQARSVESLSVRGDGECVECDDDDDEDDGLWLSTPPSLDLMNPLWQGQENGGGNDADAELEVASDAEEDMHVQHVVPNGVKYHNHAYRA
jgi:hypothetical protein